MWFLNISSSLAQPEKTVKAGHRGSSRVGSQVESIRSWVSYVYDQLDSIKCLKLAVGNANRDGIIQITSPSHM